eukprot:288674-Hanusia_phi.AAC.2
MAGQLNGRHWAAPGNFQFRAAPHPRAAPQVTFGPPRPGPAPAARPGLSAASTSSTTELRQFVSLSSRQSQPIDGP